MTASALPPSEKTAAELIRTDAWQRGYDDQMWGVVNNREATEDDWLAYELGVQIADRDMYDDRIWGDE